MGFFCVFTVARTEKKGGGDRIQLYHMENCTAARELQTQSKFEESWIRLGLQIGIQIILLMTMALGFDGKKPKILPISRIFIQK